MDLTKIAGTLLTGRDWSLDFSKLQNIDTLLSTRASETTLAGIKAKTDNLDVALSTRASESTLSAISSKLPASLTAAGNFKISIQEDTVGLLKDSKIPNPIPQEPTTFEPRIAINKDNVGLAKASQLPSTLTASGNFKVGILEDAVGLAKDTTLSSTLPRNLTQISGVALTGRDWSSDFAKLQNIDVLLSSRASETTLLGIKTQTDKLVFDASSRLRINAEVIANPPNLDVLLSTRASESTLSGFSGKFPSAIALADNLANPTTTIIGVANLGFDGTNWRRVRIDTSGRLAIQNPPNLDVALSSRASETTLAGIKTQTDKLSFDTANRLAIQNPPNLDVALSSRASESTLTSVRDRLPSSLTATGNFKVALLEDGVGIAKESTLSAIRNALASVGTDKLRITPVDPFPLSPINLTQISGTSLTARDWSSDFAKLQNIDILLSQLRDAILSRLYEFGQLVLLGSTTTPLAANASWTSPVDSSDITGRIVGSVFANQPGTLYIEQSPNNVNWDVVDSFSIAASQGLGFSVEKVLPYARVRYVNGATAQTVFRLYVYRRLRVI